MDVSIPGCPLRLPHPEAFAPTVPHETFAELRRSRPILWYEEPGRPGFWALFKYQDIVAVSQDTQSYTSERGVFLEDITSGQGIPGAILTMDPPRHTSLRARFNTWFSAKAVGELEAWLRGEARRIMSGVQAGRETEFVYAMAARLPLLTICEFLGIPEADREPMLDLGDKVIQSRDDTSFMAAMQAIGAYGLRLAQTDTSPLVAEMRADLSNDDTEFAGQFAQLLVAGNETTRTLLSNIILELCARPQLYSDIRAKPDMLPFAIEEFLRWTSPIYYMRRTATRPHEIRGQRIVAGDPVMMYYVSANRDEEVFADADTLDITRKPNRHLAFGVGRHNCLGAQLARLETRIFLEEMLAAFSGVTLVVPPVRLPSNVVNSWAEIRVRFTAAR